jgi:hypothetical protein
MSPSCRRASRFSLRGQSQLDKSGGSPCLPDAWQANRQLSLKQEDLCAAVLAGVIGDCSMHCFRDQVSIGNVSLDRCQ